MLRKVAIAAFTLATFALIFWLGVAWFDRQLSDSYCPSVGPDVRTCVDAGWHRFLVMVVPAVLGWLLLTWLTFRDWSRR